MCFGKAEGKVRRVAGNFFGNCGQEKSKEWKSKRFELLPRFILIRLYGRDLPHFPLHSMYLTYIDHNQGGRDADDSADPECFDSFLEMLPKPLHLPYICYGSNGEGGKHASCKHVFW
mgnify:CR=1 FL=1